MNKVAIKIIMIVLIIYSVNYFLTNIIGGLANLAVYFYALNLIKKQNIFAVKIILILLFIFNLGVVGYFFFA